MAPPRRQSAASSRSVSLSDAETSSDASLSTSQSSISATSTTISSPVEESLSASLLPSESSTSILDEDIGKSSLNGTDTTDVPVPSEDGGEYGIAPISTDEPFSEVNRTFLAHDSYSGPVLNGTDVNDTNSTSTSEESFSGNAISKDTSTSSQLTTSIFSRIPAPSQASETPNRITNEGAPNSSNDDLLDTAPLLFASATTFTSAGTVYVQSIFPTSIETTLPNGDVVTTAKGFTTVVAVPTAQTNVNDDGSRIQDPSGPPGPIPVLNPSSESFFQRPAAATGVFVVVLLVIGSVIWMCLIIRRHRRQVAAAANEHKRPGYMYGSTGISPRDRRSHMSYDSRNWPERFDQHELPSSAQHLLQSLHALQYGHGLPLPVLPSLFQPTRIYVALAIIIPLGLELINRYSTRRLA
ncbi:hypothetical protein M408DRAFT_96914 [Serendipita vermifera MAFF 305830]|uniref:Uncharacterized protein n=1 Tax=Serendipita vermifera MAFF 305830 TaxID=933852 RepID=A0A0C2Y068_SERVB|nr:hypothetical protein M408DRAFT_96914 [Serendipita vermifera MAFF 305830]